jgi:hypothetical protein
MKGRSSLSALWGVAPAGGPTRSQGGRRVAGASSSSSSSRPLIVLLRANNPGRRPAFDDRPCPPAGIATARRTQTALSRSPGRRSAASVGRSAAAQVAE